MSLGNGPISSLEGTSLDSIINSAFFLLHSTLCAQSPLNSFYRDHRDQGTEGSPGHNPRNCDSVLSGLVHMAKGGINQNSSREGPDSGSSSKGVHY